MVAPLIGAAARTGAKKLAKKAVKDDRDEDIRDAFHVGLHAASAAGTAAMALGQEGRRKAAEAAKERKEQESRESAAEMKRETRGMKKGGVVSSASKRADGIAIKGKTKGRFV